MSDYLTDMQLLEAELARVEQAFRGLADSDEVLMRLGEFVPSRMVEAVVHGLDLTDALGRWATTPSPPAR